MEVIVGIDQTGAVASGGKKAKALPTCLFVRDKKSNWKGITQLRGRQLELDSFHPSAIKKLFLQLGLDKKFARTVFIVDCVFGFPLGVEAKSPKGKPYLWDCFRKAAGFSLGEKKYGRDVAEAFFSKWLTQSVSGYPRRLCEELAGSNSVFQVRPYQKNIQTGTFRIWSDLGSAPKNWVNLWPFDDFEKVSTRRPWLFEGYPSYLWREVLKTRSRNPKQLRPIVSRKMPHVKVDT